MSPIHSMTDQKYKNNSSFNVLYTGDIKMTHDFYVAIGAHIDELTDSKVVVRIGGFDLHFVLDTSEPIDVCKPFAEALPRGQGIVFYVEVTEIEQLFAQLEKTSSAIVHPIEARPWGQKEFMCDDPNGYRFGFFEEIN